MLSQDPSQRKNMTIRFGTGAVKGTFYQDKLCLGEASTAAVGHLKKQAFLSQSETMGGTGCTTASFLAATDETDEPFTSCSFDGIFGLGFKDLSAGPGFNIVDDLVAARALPKNQFSVYYSDGGGSEITFGGYRPELVSSDPIWVKVAKPSYWQIAIDDIAFDNVKHDFCDGNCQVAVDSGTSLLAGPSDIVQRLIDDIDLKSDCSNLDELPALGFVIGDTVLNLMPSDYVEQSYTSCSIAIMTMDVPPPRGPLFIFGDPFLRRFLTVYDRDQLRVGFAVSADHSSDFANLIAKVGQAMKTTTSAPSIGTLPSDVAEDMAKSDGWDPTSLISEDGVSDTPHSNSRRPGSPSRESFLSEVEKGTADTSALFSISLRRNAKPASKHK